MAHEKLSEICPESVEKLARLAKLKFTQEETQTLMNQLLDILDYINKLDELDLTDVSPTSHIVDSGNVFREDKVTAGITQEEALRNAPAKNGDFFSVPKVIKRN